MSVSLYSDTFAKKSPDQMLDIRLVGTLSGCYSLSSRRDADAGVIQVFACRLQSISTKSAVLNGPVVGEIGERVGAKFDQFPVLAGVISRVFDGGFELDFIVNDKERAELAAKIDWIKKNRFKSTRDKRKHKRVMPPNPQSAITMPDGAVLECFVIDVSSSGVAISADIMPPIGTRLSVGRAVGSVTRHLATGFAVMLDELIDLDNLDPIFQWSLSYVNKDGDDADADQSGI